MKDKYANVSPEFRPEIDHRRMGRLPMTDPDIEAPGSLVRPIIGIENRTAQEVFDIMADRVRGLWRTPAWRVADAEGDTLRLHREKSVWMIRAIEAEAKLAAALKERDRG